MTSQPHTPPRHAFEPSAERPSLGRRWNRISSIRLGRDQILSGRIASEWDVQHPGGSRFSIGPCRLRLASVSGLHDEYLRARQRCVPGHCPNGVAIRQAVIVQDCGRDPTNRSCLVATGRHSPCREKSLDRGRGSGSSAWNSDASVGASYRAFAWPACSSAICNP